MHTTLTPSCLHDFTFCSLKKPRSEPYSCGACPKLSLWRCREGATCCSSFGFPSSTSYCVISPWALSARKTLRSEEHTSELQSHHDLVCRLLLEKKKKDNSERLRQKT